MRRESVKDEGEEEVASQVTSQGYLRESEAFRSVLGEFPVLLSELRLQLRLPLLRVRVVLGVSEGIVQVLESVVHSVEGEASLQPGGVLLHYASPAKGREFGEVVRLVLDWTPQDFRQDSLPVLLSSVIVSGFQGFLHFLGSHFPKGVKEREELESLRSLPEELDVLLVGEFLPVVEVLLQVVPSLRGEYRLNGKLLLRLEEGIVAKREEELDVREVLIVEGELVLVIDEEEGILPRLRARLLLELPACP